MRIISETPLLHLWWQPRLLAEIKETVWSIEPHTRAKHQILEECLKAWFPILLRWQGRVLYLDGFAGPGVYSGGEEGSPIIALKTALTHKFAYP